MGLLTGITNGINEIFDSTINKLGTWGAPGPNFSPIAKGTKEMFQANPKANMDYGTPVGDPVDQKHEAQQQQGYVSMNLGSPVEKAISTVYGPDGSNVMEVGVPPKKPGQPIHGVNDGPPPLQPIPKLALGNDNTPTTEIEMIREVTNRARSGATFDMAEWNGIIKENTARINTVLEQRSYLDFYFPNPEVGVRRVAMFQNPVISEDRSARYAAQPVLSRNEPVRLWVGSEPRQVRLTFDYTLPHVEYFWRLLGNHYPGNFDKSQLNKLKEFTRDKVNLFFGTMKLGFDGSGVSFENYGNQGPQLYENMPWGVEKKNKFGEAKSLGLLQTLLTNYSVEGEHLENPVVGAALYTQHVIDTIRASVVGDETNLGQQGPPIVRFRHGTIFNEAPFIVKSFSIAYPKDKGYEMRTLLPRIVTFTLNLEEFRQTHGSHHGDTTEQLPGAEQIMNLSLASGQEFPNADRLNYPKL